MISHARPAAGERRGIDTEALGALDVLRGAQRLVSSGWCQHADGRDAEGRAVEPWDSRAVSWSLLGAFVAQTTPLRLERGELEIGALRRALAALADVLSAESLSEWNDAPDRNADDVVDLLARAVGRLDDSRTDDPTRPSIDNGVVHRS
jgi:hypothetical protein